MRPAKYDPIEQSSKWRYQFRLLDLFFLLTAVAVCLGSLLTGDWQFGIWFSVTLGLVACLRAANPCKPRSAHQAMIYLVQLLVYAGSAVLLGLALGQELFGLSFPFGPSLLADVVCPLVGALAAFFLRKRFLPKLFTEAPRETDFDPSKDNP